MNETRRRWDRRYRSSAGSTEHARLLDELAPLLPETGSIVDVAGGSGCNALWFARRGLAATVIDISEEGLAHASAAAATSGLALETVCRDVETEGLPSQRRWDVALMHLFCNREVLLSLPAHLNPGGVLVFAQPTTANLERHQRPSRRFLLEVGEIEVLVGRLAGVEVLDVSEAWRSSGRHEARLVARRLANPAEPR